jgi:hypothetical protein
MALTKQSRSGGCAPTTGSEVALRINYGINRTLPRRRIEHKCGKLTIVGTWGDDETHKAIREKIRELNPGWMITGYCLSDPQSAIGEATPPEPQ